MDEYFGLGPKPNFPHVRYKFLNTDGLFSVIWYGLLLLRFLFMLPS